MPQLYPRKELSSALSFRSPLATWLVACTSKGLLVRSVVVSSFA